jgi:hypothetical protein
MAPCPEPGSIEPYGAEAGKEKTLDIPADRLYSKNRNKIMSCETKGASQKK